MQDPKIVALLQQNPMAQQMQSAMMAHINEHLGFEYRKQIEQQLGMSLPPQTDESGEDVQMSPEVEARLAPCWRKLHKSCSRKTHKKHSKLKRNNKRKTPLCKCRCKSCNAKRKKTSAKLQKSGRQRHQSSAVADRA
jgi:hypothetical protein